MIQVQIKLQPTKAQDRVLRRWLRHLTAVWNWAVKQIEHEPGLGIYELRARLVGHSERLNMSSKALCGTATTAHTAWRRRFDGISGRPRLKGRRRPLTSIAFEGWRAKMRGGRVYIRGIGRVRYHRQDIPEGHVGSARIVKRASGWYLCLFVHADPKPIPAVGVGSVGVDCGFSSLLTLSTGEKIAHSRELEQRELRIAQSQRGHHKQLTARLHERIRNARKNRNHHISRRLVAENQLIAVSADKHNALARSFGKSVRSSGHYQLRSQLAYKSLAGGREYVEVASRNSTRRCSACGALTGPTGWLGLKVRQWDCGACGAHHDRDVNAAVNTLVAARGMRVESRRETAPGIAKRARRRSSSGPRVESLVEADRRRRAR